MLEQVEKDLSFFGKLKRALPANRIAVILHGTFVFLTALGVFIATISKSLPSKWQDSVAGAAALIATLAAFTVTINKFLDGSQKWDTLQASKEVDLATLAHNSLGASNLTDDVDEPPTSATTPDIPESEVTGITPEK